MKNKIEVFWGKTTVGTSGGCYLESMWWEEKVQVTLEGKRDECVKLVLSKEIDDIFSKSNIMR
jgi:hypothetical protein